MSFRLMKQKLSAALLTSVAVSIGACTVGFAQAPERGGRQEERRPELREREGGDREQRERQIVELRERLQQLERQIKELRESGRLDAAEERIREFKQVQGRLAALVGGERREGQEREMPGEVRERLEQLKRRHAELREAGKVDEAIAVEREARQLLDQYSAPRQGGEMRDLPPEVRERLEQVKLRYNELREAGRLEEAEAVAREGKELLARYSNGPRDRAPREGAGRGGLEVAERLRHLRSAVEHLRAAGLNDLADRAAEQMGRIEREAGPRRGGDMRAEVRRDGDRREAPDARSAEKREGSDREGVRDARGEVRREDGSREKRPQERSGEGEKRRGGDEN